MGDRKCLRPPPRFKDGFFLRGCFLDSTFKPATLSLRYTHLVVFKGVSTFLQVQVSFCVLWTEDQTSLDKSPVAHKDLSMYPALPSCGGGHSRPL